MRSIAFTFLELAKVVPNGIVVFFPSYDFMDLFQTDLNRMDVFFRISVSFPIELHGCFLSFFYIVRKHILAR